MTEKAARAARRSFRVAFGKPGPTLSLGTKVPLARTAVERRQASAPASGGRRKPPFSVARPARRLCAGMRQCVLPAFRFLIFLARGWLIVVMRKEASISTD